MMANDGLANETNDSPDGELEVPGDDARLLVVAHGVAGQLEDLGGHLLHHDGHVDGGAGVVALPAEERVREQVPTGRPEEPVDPADGELETGPRAPSCSTTFIGVFFRKEETHFL